MASRGRLVVVEDDPGIAGVVDLYLRRDGFEVVVAGDGEQGLAAARVAGTVLAVVDIGLPGGVDGLEVCRRLQADPPVPVVLLTARDDELDRVLGLELGADDYITKPFSPRELVARVHAVLRRAARPATSAAVLVAGGVEVDTGRREARVAGSPVALTAREWELLAFLARNLGLALSRDQILEGAWGPGWYGDERTVDVHVRQLRAKLGDALPLTTVRGLGYRLG
ncbi:MAG: response regulator transcription factor [Actinomycetota bacterium]|jgi:DNA-binding response OmpR family regulator|nr:response regulator transcription factor [Actinomycetota bacterium]